MRLSDPVNQRKLATQGRDAVERGARPKLTVEELEHVVNQVVYQLELALDGADIEMYGIPSPREQRTIKQLARTKFGKA